MSLNFALISQAMANSHSYPQFAPPCPLCLHTRNTETLRNNLNNMLRDTFVIYVANDLVCERFHDGTILRIYDSYEEARKNLALLEVEL